MALSKMKLVNIMGLLSNLDDVVSVLGKSGVFQPDDAAEFYSHSEGFFPISINNEYTIMLEKIKNIIFETNIKPEIVDSKEYENADSEALLKFINNTEKDIMEIINERNDTISELADCDNRIANSKHFVGLDVEVEKIENCEYVKTNFGRIPKESFEKLERYKSDPYVDFFPCTSDSHYYWGIYATPIDEAERIDRIFSGLYFEKCEVEGLHGTPNDFLKQQEKLKEDLKQKLKKLESQIDDYSKNHADELLKVFSRICRLNAYSSIKNHAYRYNKSFILVGWIPNEYSGLIKKALNNIESVDVSFTDGKDEIKHSPPVKLKNRFFSKPFEYYTEMYGLPNYNEIDPSSFIALTYTLLFGIMFADVGHGIMLLIAGIYMYKKMKMPLGRLLIPCAVSSTVFGFVFGSVFGFEEVLNPLFKALFGLTKKPISVLDSNDTMKIILAAVGIGIVLLMIAMVLNIISSFKRKEIGEALFGVNGVCGLIFYSSIILLVLGMLLNIHIISSSIITFLIVISLILIFFREPLSKLIKGEKNIFGEKFGSFVVDNLFELFEVCLSYVTNTMSFLRVGAFVLVHAGMMQVVFVLSEMFGTVGYVITLIVGNIVVMALEALLVGIQVLRLEYYEMFSRFFIGDGRKYTPVVIENNFKTN